jgi:tetratricopeptide (TPR) repeat protein
VIVPDFRGKTSRSMLGVVLLLSLLYSPTAFPQTSEKNDPDRQHALELYDQGKMVEAMPLLEKLAADHPKDLVVMERWGVATLNYSQTLTDPELKKKARIRARSILLKAKDLGDNSNLLRTLLAGLPEDGSAGSFSDRKEVDEIMQAAEADFSRGDLDKARQGYIHALLLDPNLYTAALFIGDTYFKQKQPGSAGEWFSRAIQIDANREPAYRYWGDALVDMGKLDEARTKFINAVIAEPYNRNPWMGLGQWADHNHVKLTYLRLQDKSSVKTDGNNTTITLDPSIPGNKNDPTMAAWIVYSGSRALWQKEKFKKEFPNEPQYRRTLKEESDSLHTMVKVISELKSKKDSDNSTLDPSLAMLVKIDEAGLLDPFVLLNRADNGIAQDYPDYRAANRDKIYRYMDEFVVPKTPEPVVPAQ